MQIICKRIKVPLLRRLMLHLIREAGITAFLLVITRVPRTYQDRQIIVIILMMMIMINIIVISC